MSTHEKISLAALKQATVPEVERLYQEMMEAVNNAPAGAVIRASEEPFRDAIARFRRAVYEKAMQMRADAAQAAFPPSGPRDDGGSSSP